MTPCERMTMKGNKIIRLDVTGMTHEGQGVGRMDGMAVFVQDAIEGETVNARITKLHKSYGTAQMLECLKESPYRQKPFCPVYEYCGGCSLQHMTYEKQLQFKHQIVTDCLTRIGGLQNVVVNPVMGMESPFHYRNKAQYPVGFADNGPIAGFYARKSHRVIQADDCGIQNESSMRACNAIMRQVKELEIPVYNEKTGKGLLRHIITRVSQTGDVMVVLEVTDAEIPRLDTLIQCVSRENPAIRSISVHVNRDNSPDSAGKVKTVFGVKTMIDNIGNLKFHISPQSFYQVNSRQTQVLYEKVLEYADLTGDETVFDLYCGIGTISLFLAQKAQKVIGVEIIREAVRDANNNAELNGLTNTAFYRGKAEEVVPKLYAEEINADVVIVDPPRRGCDKTLLETMTQMRPKRMIYVSCNPATLARDLKYLCLNGYTVNQVQPVDMFPWTAHVESIIMMTYCGLEDKK